MKPILSQQSNHLPEPRSTLPLSVQYTRCGVRCWPRFALVCVLAVCAATHAQTNWIKYGGTGGPVLSPGPAGSWDSSGISGATVIDDNGTYLAWYSGKNDSGNYAVGLATSGNGINWTKFSGNPVLTTGQTGAWDSGNVAAKEVLFEAGEWRMYYNGWGNSEPARIGLATSPDGINWTKHPSNPLLEPGPPGAWDESHIWANCICRDVDDWYLWYTGQPGYQIGLATSNDGILWAKSPTNPLLLTQGTWDADGLGNARVLIDDGLYHIWYKGLLGDIERIGYAVSQDGINWIPWPTNPVLTPGSPGSWDDHKIRPMLVYRDGSRYRMWYWGYDNLTAGHVGYARTRPATHPFTDTGFAHVTVGDVDLVVVREWSYGSAGVDLSAYGLGHRDYVQSIYCRFHDGVEGENFVGGSVTFHPDVEILAVLASESSLQSSDALFGVNGDYSGQYRGFDEYPLDEDSIEVFDNAVTFTSRIAVGLDDFRVIIDFGNSFPQDRAFSVELSPANEVGIRVGSSGVPGSGDYGETTSVTNIPLTPSTPTQVDIAVGPENIRLVPDGSEVEAQVRVQNLSGLAARDVNVRLFKRAATGGFVLADTSSIAYLPSGSNTTATLHFTPDFSPQELKVSVALAQPSEEPNKANNVAFITWDGTGTAPIVQKVTVEHNGNDCPSVCGRYISGVELPNKITAEVEQPEGASEVTAVEFTLGGQIVEGTKTWDGKWQATLDMGELLPGLHTLTVVATDLAGNPSDPKEVTIEVIDLPSWAEPENSSFDAEGFDHYELGGFFPAEWAYQHSMPAEWLLIGEKENYFRAGLYTSTEVGLDGQVYESSVAPCIYVELLDIDITKLLEGAAEFYSTVKKINKIWDDVWAGKKDATIHFDQDAAVPAVLDDDTLEVVGYDVNYSASVESKWFEKSLTGITPVFFTIAGWPMSFEASLGAKIAAALTITATMDGWEPVFVQPTSIEPSVAARISGTINVVEIGIAAVGASLRPTVTFAYNIAWVPPDWDRDWLIRFALEICARLRLGLGALSQDYDLGCATLFDHDWDSEGKSDGGDFWRDPPLDPLGVLNRPVIIGGLGRGERVLVYAIDDPNGNPAEIAAQVDPGTSQWGPQTFLTNDLYADLDPAMAYTGDGRVVAVWTKVETFAADVPGSTIDELIASFNLYSSLWDGVGWSAPIALTEDMAGDGLAKVAFSDISTDGLVVWCRDEASDFDDPVGDEIAYATWDGATWSAPALLTADTLGDRQVDVCYRAGTSEAIAAWTKETDPADHLLTLYFSEWDGVAWSTPAPVPDLTEERIAQVNLAPLSDGRVVAAWGVQADDGWQVRLAIFDTGTGWGGIETVQIQLTLVDGLQLQVSSDDVVHLFWHGFTLDDDLFGMSKDVGTRSDTWVGPTKLTTGAEIEWQATGAVGADSELALIYAREQGRSREPLPRNRNGLPDELGGSSVPGGGNWTVAGNDLTLIGDPWLGETVTVEAILTNTGTTYSVATTAQFWLGDPNEPDSEPLGNQIDVSAVPPLGTVLVSSDEFIPEQVGPLDVWLAVAPPMAETDPTDNEAFITIDVINHDTIPPQVLQAQVTELSDEERLGARITVTFDEPMAPITDADVLLMGATGGQSVPDNVWLDPTGEVLTVVFEDRLSEDGYAFTISGHATDAAGNELDGNGDGTGGDDYVLTFSFLAADLNHDGQVDLADFDIFADCMAGPDVISEPACTGADFDVDNDVDLGDFGIFQRAFGGE